MLRIANYTSQKLGTIALAGLFLAGAPLPAQAWDDDDRHWISAPQCREVVKKFRVNGSLTYTERGTACRDNYGAWTMVTDTRFPSYRGEVFFKEGSFLVFLGNLAPQRYDYGKYRYRPQVVNYYDKWPKYYKNGDHNNYHHHDHDRDNGDRDHENHDNGHKGKNNHKKH